MWFTFALFALSVLLCSGCIELIGGDLSPVIQNDHRSVRTQFIDLNADVLFIVLGYSDVESFCNLVEVYPILLPLSTSVFKRKFHQIHIANPLDQNEGPFSYDSFSKQLTLTGTDLSRKTFELFGTVIERVSISYDLYYPGVHSAAGPYFVNKYGSESVKYLGLFRPKWDALQQFLVPFKGVEELSICCPEGVAAGTPLNQLFPQLRRLELDFLPSPKFIGTNAFINCELPHLEYLQLEIEKRNDGVEAFLKKNPHIKVVNIGYFPKGYLKMLPKLLPNIENLTISINHIGNDRVQFDSVKHFNFITQPDNDIYSPTMLVFPHLKTLSIGIMGVRIDIWINRYIDFIRNHRHVTRLHLESDKVDNIEPILSEFQNLTEIILTVEKLSVEDIECVIENHGNVEKIQFSIQGCERELMQMCTERFEDEWHIEWDRIQLDPFYSGSQNEPYLSFEKKFS